MKNLLIAALTLTALTAQAGANDIRVETGVEAGEFKGFGLKEDYRGVFLSTEAHYDMGLSFEGMVSSARVGSGSFGTADLEDARATVGYRLAGIGAGPAAEWQYASLQGFSTDVVRVGVLGRNDLGNGMTVNYSALSDVDNFGDEFRMSLGIDAPLTGFTTLTGNLERHEDDGYSMSLVALGGRFNVVDNMDLTAEAFYARGNDLGERVEQQGLRAGLGFRF